MNNFKYQKSQEITDEGVNLVPRASSLLAFN